MKIIQNNNVSSNNDNIEYVCEHCNSVFKYDDYDIYVDKDGESYVRCPCCNRICYIDYILTTKENILFPKSFYQFGVHEGAVEIDDSETTFWIKNCINWLEQNPNEPFKYRGSGDTFVCVFNHEDEYYIMVGKNYFDSHIDK